MGVLQLHQNLCPVQKVLLQRVYQGGSEYFDDHRYVERNLLSQVSVLEPGLIQCINNLIPPNQLPLSIDKVNFLVHVVHRSLFPSNLAKGMCLLNKYFSQKNETPLATNILAGETRDVAHAR